MQKEKHSTKGYLNMELLRFTTAGSVDDGKSTLIGRLLYDSKSIFEDQMAAIKQTSILKGEDHTNLALLTDGLRAEREQGITIDVAYRYFHTPKRKFIIADTPGHVQYTRNMVTGASTANLAIILIDARIGVLEQTKRHAYISSLLKIPHFLVAVNKMDLVDYDEDIYNKIKQDFMEISHKLRVKDIRFVPISALEGDNVVKRSKKMDWYEGATLMHILEEIYIRNDYNLSDPRFPVQYVIRPQTKEYHDYRGYAGRIASGTFKVGDVVRILPSGFTSKIKTIDTLNDSLEIAYAPQSVTLTIEDDIDISRGDIIVNASNGLQHSQDIQVMVCWFNERPLALRGKYAIKHTTNDLRCMIKDVKFKMNINTLERDYDDKEVKMNDIVRLKLRTTKPIYFDSYRKNRITGSIILIDEVTNETVAAGMIV